MKYALFLLLLCFEPCSLGAQPCLRALIIGDTVSTGIKPGSEIDIYRMKKSLAAIAHQIKYKSKIVTLSGAKLSGKRVNKWFASIKENTPDIIIFYFTGHGGRPFNRSEPLPIIALPIIKPKRMVLTVGSDRILEKLGEKNPRLGICIFDCCNNAIPAKYLFDKDMLSSCIISRSHTLQGLKSLFLKKRGLICLAAASPGQPAVTAVSGPRIGSFLTTSLLYALSHESKKNNATWKKVCKTSSAYIKNVLHGKQRPMYMLHIRKTLSDTAPL